ncbi:hypothetical protein [Aromatoleum evansii]|uniref:hypothetical protein n=1 Tax=Aromatoleum evansii TaxID=59406 RepID=UPI00145E02CC|nr:hypothetical protein [Aromatoleum evansii]NMG28288.1 hypothetical protein [Aromatoleum evansii]
MSNGRFSALPYWACVIGLVVLVECHLVVRALPFPYTPDSASYLDDAVRILADSGLGEPPSHGVPAPNPLFPPGFALSIAALGLLGFDLHLAAMLIGTASALAVPVLLVMAFRRVLDPTARVVLAAAVVTTPSFLTQSLLGLSDLFALALGLGSIGLVFQGQRYSSLALAGVLAGCAYAVRNAHAALLLAFLGYFAIALYRNCEPRRTECLRALVFFAGVGAIVLPLLMRNLATFGAINPYVMGPSTIDVITNARTMLQEYVFDLSGVRPLAIYLAWSVPGLAFLAILAGTLGWRCRGLLMRLDARSQRALLLCVLYATIGSAMVVVARSRFEWGEPINVRHTLQYSPFWFAAGLLLLRGCAPLLPSGGFSARRMAWGLTLVVLALHLVYLVNFDGPARFNALRAAAANTAWEAGQAIVCNTRRKVISNWPHVFRIGCGVPTAPLGEGARLQEMIVSMQRERPHEEWMIAIFPGRTGFGPEGFPLPASQRELLERTGVAFVLNESRGVIMLLDPRPR